MANGNGDKKILDDLQTYPVLTEEISFPGGAPAAGAGAGSGASLGQTAQQAIRDVLGWRLKAGDAKGFVAALNQVFTGKEVDGHTEWSWTPRSYAVQVQADLGAVTGAQASLYTRAKAALDQSLPLLDGLTALRVDILPEDLESIRSIVRSELIDLVAELGIPGGPRVQRVDEYFVLLVFGKRPHGLDPSKVLQEPRDVKGQLGLLRDRFGLTNENVNTVDDEQNLTNFLVLVDYVTSLYVTWVAQRQYFDRKEHAGASPFLGTQLVLLSRALAVAAEAVQEVYFALDSVFLGPAERQTIELRFPTGHLFVSELLAWVNDAVTDEGLQFIQNAGKDGIEAFLPTLKQLRRLVWEALQIAQGAANAEEDLHKIPVPERVAGARGRRQHVRAVAAPAAAGAGAAPAHAGNGQPPDDIPAGFRTARSQRAWQELWDELDEAYGLARPLSRAAARRRGGRGGQRPSLRQGFPAGRQGPPLCEESRRPLRDRPGDRPRADAVRQRRAARRAVHPQAAGRR